MKRAYYHVTMCSKRQYKWRYDFNRVVIELQRVIEASRSCVRPRSGICYLPNDADKLPGSARRYEMGLLDTKREDFSHLSWVIQ